MILAVGVAAQSAGSALVFGVAVLAPALRERYGLSLTEVGIVLAAASVGSIPALLPWGLLADRIGERMVIGLGLSTGAATLVGVAFAPDFAALAGLLVVTGALTSSVNAASGRAVMHWFGQEERGLALGLRQTAVPLGGLFASLALPPIVESGGTKAAFLALAGLCFGAAVAGVIWVREGRAAEELTLEAVESPLRDRRMWRLSLGSACLLTIPVTVGGFMVLFLHSHRGFTTAHAALVLAGAQLVGAVGRIALGRWSDRLHDRVLPMLWVSAVLTAAVALVAALVDAPSWLLVASLVVAVGLGMSWNGLSFTAAAELAGHARSGAALGFQQTVLSAGGAALPPVFAGLVGATTWRTGFALAALGPLAAFYVLGRLRA